MSSVNQHQVFLQLTSVCIAQLRHLPGMWWDASCHEKRRKECLEKVLGMIQKLYNGILIHFEVDGDLCH